MAIETLGAALGYLNRLFVEGTVSGLSDDQLLDRFLATRDGTAFEALMARHGPMVLSVCRAVLRNPSDAEDAFQATFLVLVKKARTLRGRANLGGWLHLVAYRVAIQANAAAARRRVQERRAGEMSAMTSSHDPGIPDELLPALHEEIARLPEKIRLAVVLCDLQGIPQEQAAESLAIERAHAYDVGSPSGRERLKARLGRRGWDAAGRSWRPCDSARRGRSSRRPGEKRPSGRPWISSIRPRRAGAVSAAAQSLTHEVLKMMFVQKLTIAAAALLGAGLMAWAASAALISRGDEPPRTAGRDRPAGRAPARERSRSARRGRDLPGARPGARPRRQAGGRRRGLRASLCRTSVGARTTRWPRGRRGVWRRRMRTAGSISSWTRVRAMARTGGA